MKEKFYGWWMTIFAFLTFGIAVGIPYYGGPFFYDYYEKTFGWSRKDITLGFPLASTLTLWVGPLIVHRVSPRLLIVIGTGLTALAFIGFGTMTGSVPYYYAVWFIYVVGYIFSGPIAHQVIISQWFKKFRGRAMAVVYLGVGVFGALSAKGIAKPLTDSFGFQHALMVIGGLMLLTWPIALFLMKDKPSDLGQQPDGEPANLATPPAPPRDFRYLLRQRAFWLLALGSFCSIGSIGSINQHMKFVFKEQGFANQNELNEIFATATFLILISSIGGRLIMGWMADRYNKKWVMTVTYVLVAITIPLLLLVRPEQPEFLYVFAVLFGFGMGADYMLIPLMAAEQFGVNTLARAMAIILPADTIGQTWFPYLVTHLHESLGGYEGALKAIFVLSFLGATAIALLPGAAKKDTAAPTAEPLRTAAKR